MSRKNKSIAGFGDFADLNDINNNTNVERKNNINITSDLEKVISKTPKEKTHVFKGFYLENELAQIIDNKTNGKGRGAKSDLVNAILKDRFKQEGWLQ